MSRERIFHHLAAAAGVLWALAGRPAALTAVELQGQNVPLVVTVGKSLVLDNAMNIQRISLANGDLAEAVAVNPREVLINGKAPGDTSLIIWQQGGPRLLFDLTVRPNTTRLENIRAQLSRELPGQEVGVYLEGDNVFVHGTAKDMVSADRAAAIAGTLGRKWTHTLCLICGAIGLLSVGMIHDKWFLIGPMVGVGIAWASILSMPYAVLASSLPPAKTGVYMGIFNFFIVIPEIIAAAFFNRIVNFLEPNLPKSVDVRLAVVIIGGCSMLLAALLMQRVNDPGEQLA